MANQPQKKEANSSMKLALAIALLRSKINRTPRISFSESDALRWRRKAKERKREILRLRQELKTVEDGKLCDTLTEFASCKCHFFDDLGERGKNDDEQHFNEVLRRRFLRHVRWKQRKKSGDNSDQQSHAMAFCGEDELEQLSTCVDFLVEHCSNFPQVAMHTSFSTLSHQAVDFILASLKNILSRDTSNELLEDIISSLITRLVKRMCTFCGTDGSHSGSNSQLYAQHLIRKLGSSLYVGQRALILISQKIIAVGESLLLMDPFNDAFPILHDCLFVMIQLIEFLVMDYVQCWTNTEGFEENLFHEWLRYILQAQKTFRLLENRNGLYLLYLDRIKGELVKQLGGSCQRIFPKDILDCWLN